MTHSTSTDATTCGTGACPHKACALLGVVALAVAITACGWFIQSGLENFRGADRVVTVRGLATQDVDADLAVWSIRHAATSNILDAARTQLEQDSQRIREFFIEQGLPAEAVSVQSIDSIDLMAQQYRPDNVQNGRYLLTETLVVRSTDVAAVAAAAQNMNK